MRHTRLSAAVLSAVALGAAVLPAPGATAAGTTVERFVVLYAAGADVVAARRAVAAAGGTLIKENRAVGVAVVETRSARFRVDVGKRRALLAGVARDRYIGYTPPAGAAGPAAGTSGQRTASQERADRRDVERASAGATRSDVVASGAPDTATATTREPLAALQWDMRVLQTSEAHQRSTGDRRVTVGIIDTGVDGTHPDIAANFDRARSRNFVRDIPVDPAGNALDGPCEVPGCVDPVDRDDDGHGTHVASTIAAPINGRGIAGVAPDVSIVNLRAGQDSGYFFLMPTVEAISYAGDAGIDVVNMSFYVDPWLYNCSANPADSPAEREEQRVVVAATQRAIDYAHARGVTLVTSAGNGGQDLGRPGPDASSPDYPQASGTTDPARPREVDDRTCLVMPTEADRVVVVTATGPSGRKAYYSDYGVQRADVAAPGGDALDTGTGLTTPANRILAAYPEGALRAEGLLEPDGTPRDTPLGRQVVREGGSYWRYLQGTSMASPHAAGVAALIVSERGRPDRRGELTLDPRETERLLQAGAQDQPCPAARRVSYGLPGYDAVCEGTPRFNGFFGHGVVDALAAVTGAQ